MARLQHHVRRMAAILSLCGVVLFVLRADAQPDAEAVRRAADAFDAGSQAYRNGQFELAASQFEAADRAVASARALRMAVRSRQKAGHAARAATLAAEAAARYPDDRKTTQLAYQTISAEEDRLHRLEVTCMSPCVLAVGERSVVGSARTNWVVFVYPGEVAISASFDAGGTDRQVLTASAGLSNALRFQSRGADDAAPLGAARAPAGDPQPSDDHDGDASSGSWIESPAVAIALGIATLGVAGVTIWSGVDTVENPGADAVREQCVGQGTDCPAYRDGAAKQLRTNVLIGASGGLALLTGVFAVFVTDWSGESADSLAVRSWLGPDAAGLSVGGRF